MILDLHDTHHTEMHAIGLLGLAACLDDLAETWEAPIPWAVSRSRIEIDPAAIPEVARRAFRVDGRGLTVLAGRRDFQTPEATRATLDRGLCGSLWQHGQSRKLGEELASAPERIGDPRPPLAPADVRVRYRRVASIAAAKLAEISAKKLPKKWKYSGTLLPGWQGQEVAPREWVLPLYFLPIASVTLPIGSGGMALWPLHFDLTTARGLLASIRPSRLADCHHASAEDAGLACQARAIAAGFDAPPIRGKVWGKVAWVEKQLAIRRAIRVDPDAEAIDRYAEVARRFPVEARVNSATGEWFAVASPARGLIATNLVEGRRWYDGLADRLGFEELGREGRGLRALLSRTPGD